MPQLMLDFIPRFLATAELKQASLCSSGLTKTFFHVKKCLLLLVLSLFVHAVHAQELSVKSFVVAANDLTAQSQERIDNNGLRCAVVKVRVALSDVRFDGAIKGDVVRSVGEYWVYMPKRSVELHIFHKDYIPLDVVFDDYGISQLESGTTYILTLVKPEAANATPQVQTQTLTIKYAPSSAMVLVDNKLVKGVGGVAKTTLPVGQHTFVVACDGYESEEGTVKLKASAPSNLQITLSKEQAAVGGAAAQSNSSSSASVGQSVVQQSSSQQPTSSSPVSSSSSLSGNMITIPIKDGVSIEMVRVEAGSFMMGATPEMKESVDEEKPAHRVTLTSNYYMGKYEVTQAQWQAVMGSNPSYFEGDNLPVECVSWDDCQTFISKLNSLTGRRFRLPTEAEWEYAARGGNKSHGYQYSGSSNIDDVAWYYSNSNDKTHAVGTKQPNELGLCDMTGNVWEWCQDWYGSYSRDAVTNPTGPQGGADRVRRGGSRNFDAWFCRSSFRYYDSPGFGNNYLGLRLALSE